MAALLGLAVAIAAMLLSVAGAARAGGLEALSAADRELFCALGGDAYRPNRARATRPALREADRLLEVVDHAICTARFETALARADEARARLAALPASWSLRARRARLEALAAAALAALGDEPAAQAAFLRALDLDPGFRLDAALASPKLVRLFERARGRRLAAWDDGTSR